MESEAKSNDTRLLMCPENLHEGMRLGPIHYVVDAEQARAFANAVGASSREFIPDAKTGEAIASPTMRLQDYALLIATHLKGGKGGVHAKHWCEFHEPMRVGQAVKTEGTITAAFRRQWQILLHARIRIARLGDRTASAQAGDHVGAAERQGRNAMSAAAVDIRVGAEIVSQPYLLDAHAAEAYGEGLESPRRRASRKSIHDDKVAARNAGFVAPIAAGEQTIAVIAQFLADNFGMRFVRGGRLEVALTKPVLFGDVLISHARIERVDLDHDRAELNIRVENQRGENVLSGSAAIRTREA